MVMSITIGANIVTWTLDTSLDAELVQSLCGSSGFTGQVVDGKGVPTIAAIENAFSTAFLQLIVQGARGYQMQQAAAAAGSSFVSPTIAIAANG